MKRVILGHDTMQVMPVNGDRAGMHNTLHTGIHCRGNQVSHTPDVNGVVVFFQSPWACFRGDVINTLYALHGALERLRVGQIALYHFDAWQCSQSRCILYWPHHCAHFVSTFQQHIDEVAAQETGGSRY